MTEEDNNRYSILLNHVHQIAGQVNEYARHMLTYFTLTIGGSIVALVSFLSQYTAKETTTSPDAITSALYGLIGWLALAMALTLIAWFFAFIQMYLRAHSERIAIGFDPDKSGKSKDRISASATFFEYGAIGIGIVVLGIVFCSGYHAYSKIKPFYIDQSTIAASK